MIPSTETEVANVGRNVTSLTMGIDPSAFKHIMGILTNLYSNKALAVVREYSTNARDSHIDAGCPERPIEVTLPPSGARTPSFKVQDFGVGLSLDELRDVYAQYGASSKRGSNDVNGMLGMGCKSALTYASSFTITSNKDGRKVVAVITKDDDGVGSIKVLADLDTPDSNGVTIEIPVDPHGVHSFRETALEFYRSWEPGTVLIDGRSQDSRFFYRDQESGGSHIWITPDILVTRNSGYTAKSFVVMGNVAYPHEFGTSGATIRAWVPIGEVDFTPSRESLHYTERTKATVGKIKEEFADLFVKKIVEMTASKTVFEKNDILYQWSTDIRALSGHRPVVKTDVRFTFNLEGEYASRYKQEPQWREYQNSRRHIISGFPFKSVGPSHKRRLAELLGHPTCTLFPPDADLSALEGHPRLISWDEVIKSTNKPAPKKRQATLYTARKNGKETIAENFGTGATTYYTTRNHYYSELPEINQVILKQGQVDRWLKLHPLSKTIESYLNDQRKAAEAALTDDDKLAVAIQRGYLAGPFRDVNFLKASPLLDDPLLKRVTGLSGHRSDTLTRAANLGVHVSGDPDAIATTLQERYPLLSDFRQASIHTGNYTRTDITPDLILYLNAKYQALKTAGKVA